MSSDPTVLLAVSISIGFVFFMIVLVYFKYRNFREQAEVFGAHQRAPNQVPSSVYNQALSVHNQASRINQVSASSAHDSRGNVQTLNRNMVMGPDYNPREDVRRDLPPSYDAAMDPSLQPPYLISPHFMASSPPPDYSPPSAGR